MDLRHMGARLRKLQKFLSKTRWNCKLYTDNDAQYYALSLPISGSSLPTATAVSGYRLEIGRAFVQSRDKMDCRNRVYGFVLFSSPTQPLRALAIPLDTKRPWS
jgi:hypothetical protein